MNGFVRHIMFKKEKAEEGKRSDRCSEVDSFRQSEMAMVLSVLTIGFTFSFCRTKIYTLVIWVLTVNGALGSQKITSVSETLRN